MVLLVIRIIVLFVLLSAQAHATGLDEAVRRARQSGIDSTFLRAITEAKDAGFVAKAVRINITNFSKPPDYSWSWDKASVKSVRTFMSDNDTLMASAQKKYGVRKEVIASILWIESRCGKITGTYHVPSVFLSLLMTNDSLNINASVQRVMADQSLDSTKVDSIAALVKRRADRKASWAKRELEALERIHKKQIMDVPNLHGSWAGAFGFPQFLPSSYNSWAVDGNGDRTIDLYNVADAAKSIGNYLHINGWGRSRKQQRKAVYHYNNSDAYVNAVFTLANKLKSRKH